MHHRLARLESDLAHSALLLPLGPAIVSAPLTIIPSSTTTPAGEERQAIPATIATWPSPPRPLRQQLPATADAHQARLRAGQGIDPSSQFMEFDFPRK